MEEPKSEEPLENGQATVPELKVHESQSEETVKVEETSELSVAIKEEIQEVKNVCQTELTNTSGANDNFSLTTKNLERVREELRQEEILQGRKSPFKSETAASSPVKLETVIDNLRICLFF